MFEWLRRMNPGSPGLDRMTEQFSQMLEDGRHTFDAAANALLGGTDPEVIREDLFRTDERINATERLIRRELVVHGSIHGSATFPAMLVLMSLVKDAERIGDYAKNLFDLAVRRPTWREAGEFQALVTLKDEISKLLVRCRNLYVEQDAGGSERFLADVSRAEDACDAAVERLLAVEDRNQACSVLAYRYFKRVASHAGNIATSVIMPVDQLDYFDEPRVG